MTRPSRTHLLFSVPHLMIADMMYAGERDGRGPGRERHDCEVHHSRQRRRAAVPRRRDGDDQRHGVTGPRACGSQTLPGGGRRPLQSTSHLLEASLDRELAAVRRFQVVAVDRGSPSGLQPPPGSVTGPRAGGSPTLPGGGRRPRQSIRSTATSWKRRWTASWRQSDASRWWPSTAAVRHAAARLWWLSTSTT